MLPTSASVERGDGKQTLCRLGTPGARTHGMATRTVLRRTEASRSKRNASGRVVRSWLIDD